VLSIELEIYISRPEKKNNNGGLDPFRLFSISTLGFIENKKKWKKGKN
jgi:hypothetical protein